jgi:ABC-type nitrate/sulfonate/bicarbonate transport system substrate-binding protein
MPTIARHALRTRSARLSRGFLLAALVAALAAGCGGSSASGSPAASLMLDFTPNAIHSGIYTAIARGARIHVLVPGSTTDPVGLLSAGRIDYAILDIHDLAIADAQGRGLVGVMAIVERPLASVIAAPPYRTPARLAGVTVGVTGAPSDLAVLRSIVAGARGNPARLHTETIGYDAVPDLLDGRVAAATAFWNDEGIAIRSRRPGFHVFRVEDYGAPPYPELVLTTTRRQLRTHPAQVRALVRELVAGYRAVLRDPAAGERALLARTSGLAPGDVSAQLTAELPAFVPAGGGSPGTLAPAVLRRWSVWEARFGIVRRPPDVTADFYGGFVP